MKKKKSEKFLNFLLIFFLLIFIGSAVWLIRYYGQVRHSEKESSHLKSLIEEEDGTEGDVSSRTDAGTATTGDGQPSHKFRRLLEINPDFIGWLTIDGTSVDYPVVYTPEDEQHYLRKDFEGKDSMSGTLFLSAGSDPEKPSDNLLIYGHNMRAGTMFHPLLSYEDEDFYQKHRIIHFDTIYRDGEYVVIAAFRAEIQPASQGGFMYYNFHEASSEEEFRQYVSECKARTAYPIEETAEYGDELLTLSTCSYHAKEGRFVVVARKIR